MCRECGNTRITYDFKLPYRRTAEFALNQILQAEPEYGSASLPCRHEPRMQKVLFVTSEAYPFIKTGGLGDVCGSLPAALQSLGLEVRLLLPGYHDAKIRAGELRPSASVDVPWLGGSVTLLEGKLPGTSVITWFIDYPPAYDRPGNPYLDPHGAPWYDNAPRFALFAHAATALALAKNPHAWQPDIVHCHDWQTGLVPALLASSVDRPATVFTIHNLSYQGLFPYDTFVTLRLPPSLWSPDALEFYGQVSFIKGGLAFADRLTTVSPTYAREIQTPALGYGLDGLLRHRAQRLKGIVNGIDPAEWNPAQDRHLVRPYSERRFSDKLANKLALQQAFGLPRDPNVPLLGMVGRMVEQKGVDLVIAAIPALATLGIQLIALGGGETVYEDAFRAAAEHHPGWLGLSIGYDERLAHWIEAGADMFLMPSRFEPCGLNQLYSLRYGTVPIVHRIGGLADTVVDATPENLKARRATGFTFDTPSTAALISAVRRALAIYGDKRAWRSLAVGGMGQDFTWHRSATEYVAVYRMALDDAQAN